jgi:hypothetical protein
MDHLATHRLAKVLFRLSDVAAWLVLLLAIFGTIGNLLIDVIPSNAPTIAERLCASGLCAIVAVGAFTLTRRHLFGLPLVMLVPVAFGFYHTLLLALAYAALALSIFGTPFAIAFVEVRQRSARKAS